jgi:hypothetical protein
VSRFAAYLADYGWSATVLAPRNGSYYRDPELSFASSQVMRTGSIEFSRVGKQLLHAGGDDIRAAEVGGIRARVRDAARRGLYFPDGQIGWYLPALITAWHRLRHEHFDAVFSSSFPITSHLVARRIGRYWRVPWVAEFRDPWSEMLAVDDPTRARAARLERELAQACDAAVMVSPFWAEHHARLWGRAVSVIPNGHDGTIQGAAPNTAHFTLGYLGSYYPATQTLKPVWRALAELGDPAVRLRFIGELHPALAAELAQHGLSSQAESTGFVPHRRALAELACSSALLLAGPRDASGILRGQVAAKLPEYLASDLPIIYIGDPDCDAADVLRGYPGTFIVAPDDAPAALAALLASRDVHLHRNVSRLSRHQLAGELGAVLDGVASRRTS